MDGAFYADVGQGASGVVLRSSTGEFLVGRARWYPHGLDALTIEALACRDGLEAARDRGVACLQLEADCQELANLWSRGDYQRSFLAPILSEIKELSLNFSEFILLYANRSCNRVAHLLAKQVTSDIMLGEWHAAPICIDHLLAEDCNPAPPG